jgi:hypothetical protein
MSGRANFGFFMRKEACHGSFFRDGWVIHLSGDFPIEIMRETSREFFRCPEDGSPNSRNSIPPQTEKKRERGGKQLYVMLTSAPTLTDTSERTSCIARSFGQHGEQWISPIPAETSRRVGFPR